MRILVIEDDRDIARAIEALLERARYAVDVVRDGDGGLDRLLRGTYDAAVVDVMLPGRSGFEICRRAREEKIATPLLILSARDAIEDRIAGLDAGADDYLIKPFSSDELEARLRALLRRAERAPQTLDLRCNGLEIDPIGRVATVDGVTMMLGATEFRLLEYFVRNRGMTLSRAQILAQIWDYDFDGSSNIVDVYVSQLRRKLRARGAKVAIATVWGVGYKLDDATRSRARS